MPAYLPDVNILLALTFEAHQHHTVAARWIADVEECRVCRIVQSGFLRLSSNPALFESEALTISQAWNAYDTLMEDGRFSFSSEPLGLEHLWRRLSNTDAYSPKVWTDRYLAAFAIADDLTLATFDKGFESVTGLRVKVLAAPSG